MSKLVGAISATIGTGTLVDIFGIDEADALRASPIACAVADAWVEQCHEWKQLDDEPRPRPVSGALCRLNDALVFATRDSPLRKVKP